MRARSILSFLFLLLFAGSASATPIVWDITYNGESSLATNTGTGTITFSSDYSQVLDFQLSLLLQYGESAPGGDHYDLELRGPLQTRAQNGVLQDLELETFFDSGLLFFGLSYTPDLFEGYVYSEVPDYMDVATEGRITYTIERTPSSVTPEPCTLALLVTGLLSPLLLLGRRRWLPVTLLLAAFALLCPGLRAQEDGSPTLTDGGGTGVLESIYVPNLPNAPFSLTLHTELIKTLPNGGTFTTTNDRPLARDTAGRIYQERWLLTPKGSGIPSRMTAIQIDDPVAHMFYTCMVRTKVCEIQPAVAGLAHYDPTHVQSGPIKSDKGTFLHEDLGAQSIAGLLTHRYRDTFTLDAGTFGNDAPMATIREFSYSPELGFNLTSVLDSAQVGRQVFTVTDLTTTEPDPGLFRPPAGYRLVDRRKPTP